MASNPTQTSSQTLLGSGGTACHGSRMSRSSMKCRCRSSILVPVAFSSSPNAADDQQFPVVGSPDGNRRSPVAVAADCPIARILEPFSKTPVFDIFRHPMDLRIAMQHAIFHFFNCDKPCAHGLIDKGCVGTPAEGIAVVDSPS